MQIDQSIFPPPVPRRQPMPAAAPPPPRAAAKLSREEWQILGFVACVLILQLGLFVLGNTALRLPLRIGSYALSLGMLFLVQRTPSMHPAGKMLQYVAMILAVGFINPAGDRMIARLAQICLYFSVLAPLLWAARRPMQLIAFERVIVALWLFYTLSATVGVLQVHYPGRFDGATSENYEDMNMAGHTFTLANGQKYVRPKGLTDTPGGAALGGVNAIALGCGVLLTNRSKLLRLMSIGGTVIGLYAIYICEGRTNLVIVAIVALVVLAVLMRRGNVKRATLFATVMVAAAFVGTTVAIASGGQAVVNRFFTSGKEADAGELVYEERGRFLNELVFHDAIPDFLGAGQGRWGMMYSYFGHTTQLLWAEMMWQALLYDGGIPLIAIYVAILGICLSVAWKIASTVSNDDLGSWAAVVLGFDIAAIAASFVFPIFSIEMGLEVFLVNACLYATAENDRQQLAARRAARAGGRPSRRLRAMRRVGPPASQPAPAPEN